MYAQRSHPSWVCGLKLAMLPDMLIGMLSHPSWVCGLKLQSRRIHAINNRHTLRGCVDWNMSRSSRHVRKVRSHPSWVCGLKLNSVTQRVNTWRHTLRGCVDWNLHDMSLRSPRSRHTLRGCVDWNILYPVEKKLPLSHTLRGCVDWNNHVQWQGGIMRSHPSWVCGLKQKTDFIFWAHLKKSFLRKRAIDCQ